MKKRKTSLKRGASAQNSKSVRKGRNKSSSLKEDFFFDQPKRRKLINDFDDEDIDEDDIDVSGDSGDEGHGVGGGAEEVEDDEFEKETADEKRQRVAKAYIDKIREIVKREKEDEDEDEDEDEKEGRRDSVVADILQQEQLEESGRVRRLIASRVQKPEIGDNFRILVKHRQSVTAIALSDDDSRGFSASKEGTILHWDVITGKGEKYLWPNDDTLRSHGAKDPQGRVSKHSKTVLDLAVSSDGRYLASGGLDRHVHLWDTRTREHIQAFPGHRGPVSCLTFKEGTAELFSGSFDRTIKMWNAEDRAYINTLFGHQSEVLTIDCLRKERVLAVGRDRTMQLFKIPEETRIVFRAPASSLECCCFISNDEYISGSDDGSIELWNILRKKPVYTAKNAHPYFTTPTDFNEGDNGKIPNGCIENGDGIPKKSHYSTVFSWVSAITLCRGSDLAASGAGNGLVRLWAVGNESKNIQPLHELPLVGFVNSLAFAKSGKFLIAGVGREPRLGRWGCLQAASNGVAIQSLQLS